VENLAQRVQLVDRVAEIVSAVMQLIKQPRISIAITERSSGATKVEPFGPRMGRRSAFHFVISRMSIAVVNKFGGPGHRRGGDGWSGATSAVGQELPS
jgi:hypothetical protein